MDRRWDDAIAAYQGRLRSFLQGYASELATFRPEVFSAADLTAWQAEAHEATKRLLGKTRHLQAVADHLAPYLTAGAAVGPRDVARVIGRLLAARTEAVGLYQELQGFGGVQLPRDWLPTTPSAEQHFTAAVAATGVSRSLLAERPTVWNLFAHGVQPNQFTMLDRLASVWRAWLGVLQTSATELAEWCGELGWFDAWQRDGATWLAELHGDALHPLQRWGAVLGCLDVLAAAGLPEYRLQLLRAQIDADPAEEAFRRGLMATAVAERLRTHELEYFNSELHDGHIAQFEAAAAHLRTALPEPPAGLAGTTPPVRPGRAPRAVRGLRGRTTTQTWRQIVS